MPDKPKLEDLLVDLFESACQATHDFCGEQRDWHVPRLNRAMWGLTQLFPAEAARAMDRCKNPYGDELYGEGV